MKKYISIILTFLGALALAFGKWIIGGSLVIVAIFIWESRNPKE